MANIEQDDVVDIADAEPSTLADAELYISMKNWFLADYGHSDDWRTQARKDFDFRAGNQWEKTTADSMTTEGRVPIVFNRVLPVIKAVAGIEINTRHETIYLPRNIEEGDIQANEDLTAASRWMGDGCNAKHQESGAFQDAITCGMGWVEERMDYELDPDGKYIEEQLNPLEMFWDGTARQMNLADSRRRWRARKMPLGDAKAMFPDAMEIDLNCSWAKGAETGAAVPVEDRRLKSESNSKTDPKSEVTILQCQWWEREKYNRVANPFTGQVENLNDDELKILVAKAKEASELSGQHLPVDSVKQTRRVYKQAFLGAKILKNGPCPRVDGFTLHCITGELDHTKGTWFGLISMMRDPQMMANKWLSQTTHIINTTAKGGIIAEEDAFVDPKEARAEYARPDAITWAKKGAIAGNKIMQKPGVGLAAPYVQLVQMAVDSIPAVTGINMELMGLRDVNQPGVLEAQRKQAAMTILATIFDSLSGFRIEVGRTRLYFIQNYIEDGRIIRVIGNDGKYKGVRLLKDKMVGDYDVIVEEAPSSPNQKEVTWAALQTVLPALKEYIDAPLAVKLLSYVPGIPQQLVADFQASLQERMQPNPEVDEQKAIAKQGAIAKVQRDEAAAQKDLATADKTRSEIVIDQATAFSERMRAARDQAQAVRAVNAGLRDVIPQSDQYAIAPMDTGMRQVRQLPQLPAGPVDPAENT